MRGEERERVRVGVRGEVKWKKREREEEVREQLFYHNKRERMSEE